MGTARWYFASFARSQVPEKRREDQKNFLADSLTGLGQIKPLYSRDICERDRVRPKREHYIIKYEFWIGLDAHAVTKPDPAITLARNAEQQSSSALKPPL